MALKNLAHDADHKDHKIRFDENLRGAVIVVVGSVALVGLAWGAMMMLTSPDGWVTKAANSAVAGEGTQLVSFSEESAQ
jgi:hypothetical protein